MNSVPPPLTHLGEIPVEVFLAEYWQKKPLFVPAAFNQLAPLDPNELAGFALEDGIESRLIKESPNPSNAFGSRWEITHGPLAEETFSQLPASHWTLLVQAVDQLAPQINRLLHQFRFLPNWRIDDVMVSYAVDGGGVGPHFDYYDVFLLQAAGQRRWRIGDICTHNTPLQQDVDMKLLTSFDTRETYLSSPGDLLYIPPNVSHWGIAQGECMTYSVGFRAPSHAEMLEDFALHVASTLTNDQRFEDAGRMVATHAGELTHTDVAKVRDILLSKLQNTDFIADWFARFMTDPKRAPFSYEDPVMRLTPDTRSTYLDNGNGSARLYINSQVFDVSVSFAQQLSSYKSLQIEELTPNDRLVIEQLLDLGWLQ